jgi:hypothetical protein
LVGITAVANLGGNPLLFLQGCYGRAAAGSLFVYQSDTALAIGKVPSAAQQPQILFTQGGSLAIPGFPAFTNDGDLAPLTKTQQATVATIDFANGNWVLTIPFDPAVFPGSPFTVPAVANNVKSPTGSGLPNSPIGSLNPELAQASVTGAPVGSTPQRMPQPLHWDCDKVKQAESMVSGAAGELAALAKKGTPARKLLDKTGAPPRAKFLQASAKAQAAFKADDAALKLDDYKSPLDTSAGALGALKAVEVAGKALAAHITSAAAKQTLLRGEQKAVADARAALAAAKGAVTAT